MEGVTQNEETIPDLTFSVYMYTSVVSHCYENTTEETENSSIFLFFFFFLNLSYLIQLCCILLPQILFL